MNAVHAIDSTMLDELERCLSSVQAVVSADSVPVVKLMAVAYFSMRSCERELCALAKRLIDASDLLPHVEMNPFGEFVDSLSRSVVSVDRVSRTLWEGVPSRPGFRAFLARRVARQGASLVAELSRVKNLIAEHDADVSKKGPVYQSFEALEKHLRLALR